MVVRHAGGATEETVYPRGMNARAGSLFLSCVVAAAVAVGSGGCEQGTEPPPETPKSSATRPPDVTEVTMEVSDTPPPGENGALRGSPSPSPSATVADGGASVAASGADPSEDPNIGGVQSDPTVEKAVAPVRPRLRACYKKALAADPNVGGSATFDATIGKDGKVASARFVKRDGLDEEMVGCLLAAVKAMTFDATKKSQIVTLTFGSAPAAGATAAVPAAPGDAGAPKR